MIWWGMTGFAFKCLQTGCTVWLSDLFWLDVSFESWKHEHKLIALIVLYDLTLPNKHAVIQMDTLHDLARTVAILTWKPLCSQYCQLPSIKQQTYENSWIKSKIVMAVSSWPSGQVCANYFNAMFTFAELKPSKQSWPLFWDTCTGTKKIPNYLFYLEHLFIWFDYSVRIKTAAGHSSLELVRL